MALFLKFSHKSFTFSQGQIHQLTMRTQGPDCLRPRSLVHLCLKKKKRASPLSFRLSVGGKVDPSGSVPGSGVNDFWVAACSASGIKSMVPK